MIIKRLTFGLYVVVLLFVLTAIAKHATAAPVDCRTRAAQIKDPKKREAFYQACIERVREDLDRYYRIPRAPGPAYDGTAPYDRALREQGRMPFK